VNQPPDPAPHRKDDLGCPVTCHDARGDANVVDNYQCPGGYYQCPAAPADSASGTVGDFLDEVPHGAVIVIDNDIPPGRVRSPRGSGRANVACCGTSRLIDFSWVKEDSRSVKGGHDQVKGGS
jgi:hypothetical protein